MKSKLLILGMLILMATPAAADKIRRPVDNWIYTQFQGQITSISPQRDYLMISENQVFLVDIFILRKNRRYQTQLLDLKGNELTIDDFTPGKWAIVKGGTLPNKTIGARVIFLLDERLTRAEAQKYPILIGQQEWDRSIFGFRN